MAESTGTPGMSDGPRRPGGTGGAGKPGGSGRPDGSGTERPHEPGGSGGPGESGGSGRPDEPGRAGGPDEPGGSGRLARPAGSAGPDEPGGSGRLCEPGTAPVELAAFQGLVLRRLDEIREAQRAALADPTRTAHPAAAPDAPDVELVTGARAIAARYRGLQRTARREILALAAGPVVAVPAAANSGQREAMRAGVRYRVVYERDALALTDSDTPPLLEHWASLGEEMRVAFGLPLKLVLVDRATALVVPLAAAGPEDGPEDGPGEPRNPEGDGEGAVPTATVLRSRPLLDALGWIFDRVWDSALPVPAALAAAVDGPLTAHDRRLLTLLLNGYTDQAIGSQLGVSERTVQRRVRRLLALAGARSRLQLGWHAARHHWL
ncbi:helix-turn-helix transcriptional regulator [Streptomyces sp. NK15101]|uniref:helix-turn-helix transcriptional regulator n=1 Tax=Streptomyces sp. NK15101 TaxID=2873261 RepID=UPI0027DEEDF4|nr:helix-turn-helix transcriptional regulator [Streptomyces sp. NK15101]